MNSRKQARNDANSKPFTPHFLQSRTWEKYQKLEGHNTFYIEADDYIASGIITKTNLGNYLYCAYGPAAKDEKSLQAAIKAVHQLAKDNDAYFIRIEPTLVLSGAQMAKIAQKLGNYHIKKTHDLDPMHTWIIDYKPKLDDVLADIEKEKTRVWRNHSKKGISIRTTTNPDDIPAFMKLLRSVADNGNYVAQEENHLKNQLRSGFGTLYLADLAEQPDQPIAGILVFDYEGTRYAMHAAADYEHRRLKAGAILQVQTIVDSYNAGGKHYDFWGVTDSEDPKHPWYGFTQYKKTFGGHQVDYTGTYDIILKPAKYRLYTILRKINRTKRLLLSKLAK